MIRVLHIIILLIIQNSANADSLVFERLKRNFEFGLGGGLENSSYEFRTTGASSVLSYDRMKNKQLHLDAKYKFLIKTQMI